MSEDVRTLINAQVLPALSRIETKTEEHIRMTQNLSLAVQGSNTALGAISTHTQQMAKTLGEMHNDNRALISAVAGKNHVPLVIFIIVVGVMGIIILMRQVDQSNSAMKIGKDSFEITPK